MINILIILICILIINNINTFSQYRDTVKIEYVINLQAYSINILLGSEKQNHSFTIDQTKDYMWTTPLYFDPTQSKTFIEGENIKTDIINKDSFNLYTGTNVSDTCYLISIDELPIPSLSFLYFKDISIYRWYTEWIGFSFQIRNTNTSIVHKLHEQGVISRLIYGFEPVKINNNGTMFIGNKPLLSNTLFKGYCNVNTSISEWSCKLNEVIINNTNNKHIYTVNHNYVVFQSAKKYIYVPNVLYEYLKEHYFTKEIFTKSYCNYKDNYQSYSEVNIMCNCNVVKQLPNITFYIGNYYYTFDPLQLFHFYDDDLCDFLIVENKHKEKYITLGYTFFRKFYIFFDYQNAMIEIYLPTPQIQPIPSFYANIFNINFIKYIIYLFISSSMFITICYNIIIKLTI